MRQEGNLFPDPFTFFCAFYLHPLSCCCEKFYCVLIPRNFNFVCYSVSGCATYWLIFNFPICSTNVCKWANLTQWWWVTNCGPICMPAINRQALSINVAILWHFPAAWCSCRVRMAGAPLPRQAAARLHRFVKSPVWPAHAIPSAIRSISSNTRA